MLNIMTKKIILKVGHVDVALLVSKDEDFLSLTDIAKRSNSVDPNGVIANWMRNKETLEFLGLWESLSNPQFDVIKFNEVLADAGRNTFTMSPTRWSESTAAIGIVTKKGRYGGGTFAHKDIALEFCSWISPAFKFLLIREFQRLKAEEEEQQQEIQGWNVRRLIAKVNYVFHTDAIKELLVPPRMEGTKLEGMIYASEADLINVALFGVTAKEWRAANPDAKGNIRDHASVDQLLVLANLETLNSDYVRNGLDKATRLRRLNDVAIYQMTRLFEDKRMNQLALDTGTKRQEEKPKLDG
jgi:hypothetical protein